MICGHPSTQQLWVDIAIGFFFCVGWGKMGLLAARGGGGGCGVAQLHVSRLQHPWGDTCFWEPNWRRSMVTFWHVGTEMYSSCLRAPAESESSDCWQELTEEKEAGNHKPLIDSLSFLQPIPSTNHIWKYSFQASFTMAKKKKNSSLQRELFYQPYFSLALSFPLTLIRTSWALLAWHFPLLLRTAKVTLLSRWIFLALTV